MDFNIKECKWCRRPFQQINQMKVYCEVCDRMLDEAFVKIRDYLDENPGANTQQVSEGAEIDEKIILQLLKDDRIGFVSGSYLTCEQCGAKIERGRFCKECQGMMKEGLGQMLTDYNKKAQAQAYSMSTPDFHNKIKR